MRAAASDTVVLYQKALTFSKLGKVLRDAVIIAFQVSQDMMC